jgi:hypothetical protein
MSHAGFYNQFPADHIRNSQKVGFPNVLRDPARKVRPEQSVPLNITKPDRLVAFGDKCLNSERRLEFRVNTGRFEGTEKRINGVREANRALTSRAAAISSPKPGSISEIGRMVG